MTDRSSAVATSARLCPLCGEANDCAMAAGESAACWCSGAVFPAQLRERAASSPARCICARCAAAAPREHPSPPVPDLR